MGWIPLRPLAVVASLALALGPAAAPAQTVLNGGGALSGEGGAKRLTVPQRTPAEDVMAEEDDDSPGLAARAGAFFRGMTGRGGSEPEGEDEVLTGAEGSPESAPEGGLPETEASAQAGAGEDDLQGAGVASNPAALLEQVDSIGEAREAALERAAAMGRLMSDMDRAQGEEARANRLAEEARRASLPPTPADTLFAEFGRQPRAVTPFEASLDAAGFVRETQAPSAPPPTVVATGEPAAPLPTTVDSSGPAAPSPTVAATSGPAAPLPTAVADRGPAAPTADPSVPPQTARPEPTPVETADGADQIGDAPSEGAIGVAVAVDASPAEGEAPAAALQGGDPPVSEVAQAAPVGAAPPAVPPSAPGWSTAPGRALAAAEGLGERLAQRFLGVPAPPAQSQPTGQPPASGTAPSDVLPMPVRSATHSMDPTPPIFQNADGSWPEPSEDQRNTLIFMARTMFEVCRAELYPDGSFALPTF